MPSAPLPNPFAAPDPALALTPEQLYQQELAGDHQRLIQLLPVAAVQLTTTEQEELQAYQTANLILGSAASIPMLCSEKCPIRRTCRLYGMGKHPVGRTCPIELNLATDRFLKWMQELEKTLATLLESERAAIASLITMDLQERRCNEILRYAENASMESRTVRDVDTDTGEAIAWEDVIHTNKQILDTIYTQRRMLLDDLELTRKAKTRKQKMLNSFKSRESRGDGLRWSEATDRIRRVTGGDNVMRVS